MLKDLRGVGRFGSGGIRLVFVVATHGSIVGAVVRREGLECGMIEKRLSCL